MAGLVERNPGGIHGEPHAGRKSFGTVFRQEVGTARDYLRLGAAVGEFFVTTALMQPSKRNKPDPKEPARTIKGDRILQPDEVREVPVEDQGDIERILSGRKSYRQALPGHGSDAPRAPRKNT